MDFKVDIEYDYRGDYRQGIREYFREYFRESKVIRWTQEELVESGMVKGGFS